MSLKLFLLLFVPAVVVNGVPNSRIRGGQRASKPYPYQVSLQVNATVYDLTDTANTFNDWGHWCGGSIITNFVILTAGHCLTDFDYMLIPEQYYSVFAGTERLDGPGTRYYLGNNLTHPKYSPQPGNYDIAIISTSSKMEFIPKKVQPIAYSNVETGSGVTCVVTGWGNMGSNGEGKNPIYLRELQQSTLTNRKCNEKMRGVTDTDICAFAQIYQGHCNGDSGGPLVEKKTTNTRWHCFACNKMRQRYT